jgi:trans-aconitate 2-methyltransferase
MTGKTQDWNPGTYARFRGLRLRPAMDLLAQVGSLPDGAVVDLGCGDGAVGPALRLAYPGRRLIGVDSSPAMLAQARGYDALAEADIAAWCPDERPALIFSNAALQWVDRHAQLMPHLARLLAPGGVLAVQMPGQGLAPSHALLRETAARLLPDHFDFADYRPPVAMPDDYWRMLSPFGQAMAWETTYLQHLPPQAEGHPVRAFTESTAMRPFVQRLTEAEAAQLRSAYDLALEVAYPRLPDGGVLMPFRRVFFVLRVTA